MASIMPNPTSLSNATRLPPSHARTFSRSRSPSRSPVRKAQFAAKELDPLLQNLSPDATLDALQKTNTIAGSQAEQTALAKSISDASESERELGIRAAIAAKNLRQWSEEVLSWPWPSREDRAWGAGFIPPLRDVVDGPVYFGYLPEPVVKQYEDRLDEIWDAIETLGMDDLKDYVFSSHNPRTSSSETPKSYPSSYGRMRDFTALVTAIVIQALPVQANLLILLDTWSIRLTVLREVPALMTRFDQVKQALAEIKNIIRDPKISRLLTKSELETAKVIFENKVSRLGKRVDTLLDLLEGQEDSLPQAWLDSLDDIENKYAEWVSQADQVVLRNQMAKATLTADIATEDPSNARGRTPDQTNFPIATDATSTVAETHDLPNQSSPPTLPSEIVAVKRKPLHEMHLNPYQKHQRGISEVSAADSTFSGYSLENAEIVDAVETKVMPSPRISVIDHQYSPDKISVPWMKGGLNVGLSPTRPGMPLQRASTASIEVIPKHRIKEVVLRRSASHDMLSSKLSSSQNASQLDITSAAATPSQLRHNQASVHLEEPPDSLTPLAVSPSPSLMVDPLSLRGKALAPSPIIEAPIVPRRSSKRLSMPMLESYKRPTTPLDTEKNEPHTAVIDEPTRMAPPPTPLNREATFDDTLKSILASMPTRFKLTAGSESGRSSPATSETSTRASSPVQTLKLSPVRDHKSGRYQSTSGIRVYNLSKSGKSRDAQPIKLFVRAVGEHGERVMVRVGGGWADLAEYLREYSLHHGGRGLSERGLEVAGYPQGKHAKTTGNTLADAGSHIGPDSQSVVMNNETPDPNFDFGLRQQDTKASVEADKSEISLTNPETDHSPIRPLPVPLIPTSRSPKTKHQTTSPKQNTPRSSTPVSVSRPGSRISVHTSITPGTTTTTTTGNNYTPLGAAGPVQNSRRSASHALGRSPNNEAWVNGMVNQARSVSGSHANHTHPQTTNNSPNSIRTTTTISSPTTTTTTIMSSRIRSSTPASTSKRASVMASPTTPTPAKQPVPSVTNTDSRPVAQTSPIGSQLSKVSSDSSGSYATANTEVSKLKKNEHTDGRRRSIMGLGDVGGIRRVFLRKKSEK